MNKAELKGLIAGDLQTLKNLDPDIISVGDFYGEVGKRYGICMLLMLGIPLLQCLILFDMPLWQLSAIGVAWFLVYAIFFTPFFILPPISQYVTFKNLIKPHLKLGALIEEKYRLFVKVFFGVYFTFGSLCTLLASVYFADNPDIGVGFSTVLFMVVGFIVSMITIATFMSTELHRAGLAILFDVMGSFINPEPPPNPDVRPRKRKDPWEH